MIAKFCPECGAKLIGKPLENEGVVPFCEACNTFRFPYYSTAVSMVVRCEDTGRILLIQQYGRHAYVLVAGYINRTEAAEHAVAREIREETGMTVTRIKFNRTKFYEPSDTLMCNFTAWVKNENELHTNEEVDAWRWFTPAEARENILPGSLAAEFLNAYLDECEGN